MLLLLLLHVHTREGHRDQSRQGHHCYPPPQLHSVGLAATIGHVLGNCQCPFRFSPPCPTPRAVSAAEHDVSVGGPVVAPDVRTNGPAELLAELLAQCASDDVRAHVGAIEFSQRRADGRADCRAFVLAVGRPVGPSDRRPVERAERCALEHAERRAVSAA